MYKKITHTIVEEHFDSVNDAKVSWKAPLRYYDDGEQISSNLPQSYQVSTLASRCENCVAFNPDTSICRRWTALVRPEHICDQWSPIPQPI